MTRTCSCACGSLVTLTGPMDTWDVPMLAHVRTPRHREWSATQTEDVTIMDPHLYEEHVGSLLAAGRSTSATRGMAGGRSSASASTGRSGKAA